MLPPGANPLTVLQVSDLHLRLQRRRMIRFLESLGAAEYDLVLATGDLLGDPGTVDECLRLLNGLRARCARAFVFGSSDYYAPVFKNYFDYFHGRRRHGPRHHATDRFRLGLIDAGWLDLNNRDVTLELNATRVQVTGVDDPYLGRDDRSLLVRNQAVEVALLVTHDPAPYRAALGAGYDLVLAGHTHGGQVRMPWVGALVTNSTVPRHLARGPSQVDGGWLFVTPGVGTGRFAPIRFLCPPEASVLELVGRAG